MSSSASRMLGLIGRLANRTDWICVQLTFDQQGSLSMRRAPSTTRASEETRQYAKCNGALITGTEFVIDAGNHSSDSMAVIARPGSRKACLATSQRRIMAFDAASKVYVTIAGDNSPSHLQTPPKPGCGKLADSAEGPLTDIIGTHSPVPSNLGSGRLTVLVRLGRCLTSRTRRDTCEDRG